MKGKQELLYLKVDAAATFAKVVRGQTLTKTFTQGRVRWNTFETTILRTEFIENAFFGMCIKTSHAFPDLGYNFPGFGIEGRPKRDNRFFVNDRTSEKLIIFIVTPIKKRLDINSIQIWCFLLVSMNKARKYFWKKIIYFR